MIRSTPAPRSLVGRLVLAFLLPSLVILVLGALAAYLRTTAALRQSVFERLDAIATVKESALDTWVEHLSREVVLFSELPELRELASELVTGAPPEARRRAARARLADLLRLALEKRPGYREMFFLAPTGGGQPGYQRRIWVESEGEGQGSTFCFTLPATGQRAAAGDAGTAERVESSADPG